MLSTLVPGVAFPRFELHDFACMFAKGGVPGRAGVPETEAASYALCGQATRYGVANAVGPALS